MAGIYVIIESWLNHGTTNQNRGSVLSSYMVLTTAAIAGSQIIFAVGDAASFELFVVGSALMSLALVPLALSNVDAPSIEAPVPLSLRRLWSITPTGLVVIFVTGISVGALRGMTPVFATEIGLQETDTAALVAATAIGATLLQAPIGRISDRVPRRGVMLAVATAAAVVAVFASVGQLGGTALIITMFALGGLAIPMYSLSIAYTNDWVEPNQRVPAAALLIVVNGAGAILGPISAATAMNLSTPYALFGTLAITHALTGLFLLTRIASIRAPRVSEQSRFLSIFNRGAGLAALRWIEARRTKSDKA